MKEILNEWRKFVNENKDNVKDCSRDPSCTDEEFVAYLDYRKSVGMNEEEIGEEYHIKSMTPTTLERFFKEALPGRHYVEARKILVVTTEALYTGDIVYYKLELSNGEKYLAIVKWLNSPERNQMEALSFKPADDDVSGVGLPANYPEIEQGPDKLVSAALKFLQQDAPYENSPRPPEDEEK